MMKFVVQSKFISKIRLSGQSLDEKFIQLTFAFFIINIFLVFVGGCLMVLLNDMDYQSALSSVVSALMNIGPGFGSVGPTENYQHLTDTSKWFLSWMMLVGRVEMFTALIIFVPTFWK